MSIIKDNPRKLAWQTLNSIFIDGAYGNLAVSKALGNNHLSDQDRRFFTELVYGTVKTQGTLDWLLSKCSYKELAKLEPRVRTALRLGAYQIYYLSKVPASAACNETVELVKSFGHEGMVKFVNGVLRNLVRQKATLTLPSRQENLGLYLALNYYHPQWLIERWRYRYGWEAAEQICEYDNKPPRITLRVNTKKITREALMAKLTAADYQVEPSPWSKDGLRGIQLGSVGKLMQEFGSYIYIQDESSMLAADILAPQAGDLVVDVCSAPGGKTTHLAQKMEGRGKVLAMDIYDHKLKLVAENAKRLGLTNIITKLQDARELMPELVGKADRVLVDAPCSGLGVLGRRPEARWRKVEKELSKFPPVQKQILATAAQYVKPGGYLLYSTCTLEQDENTRVVADFLSKNENFTQVGFKHPQTGETVAELQLLPQVDDVDGFYLCLLQRRENRVNK